MRNPIHFLRQIGWAEAVSFLVLVGVAMPLKYVWHMPQAVRMVGMIHGILFIAFCVALGRAAKAAKWPMRRSGLVFVAALLPFGPFLLDRRIRGWEVDFESRAG